MLTRKKIILIIIYCLAVVTFACSKKTSGTGNTNPGTTPLPGNNDVDFWLTKSDQSVLLQKQSTVLSFGAVNNSNLNQTDKNKKLVKTTAIVKASNAGASRGSFSASAYCFSGKTAMGHAVRRGLIAADPRVLKLGSTVYINAGPWSGTYLVSDTGGAIKGKKIDIWVPNCSEARRFGRRGVEVFSTQ